MSYVIHESEQSSLHFTNSAYRARVMGTREKPDLFRRIAQKEKFTSPLDVTVQDVYGRERPEAY